MRVIDPGHIYALEMLGRSGGHCSHFLAFVKRIGKRYPGNKGNPFAGTTSQEVLRALIDRANYVNGQIPCPETEAAIGLLRAALVLFELRAARIHKRELNMTVSEIADSTNCCSRCGHVGHKCEGNRND